MDEPTKRLGSSHLVTPEERAEIEKEQDELLAGWYRLLSREEAVAWVGAHIEDLQAKIAELEREDADWEAVMRISEGHRNPIEAMESVSKKEQRTLAEAEALDAFKRIKYKLIRLIMELDPISQRIVDLLEASETKSKTEYRAVLALADKETLNRLNRITGRDWREQL
jgi:hypothetical protein